MDSNHLNQSIVQMRGSLSEAQHLLERTERLAEMGSISLYREVTMNLSRHLEKTCCKVRLLVSETANLSSDHVMGACADAQGITIEMLEHWYKITLPALIPNKHTGSCQFLTAPLTRALSAFTYETRPLRLKNCVLCFRHIYAWGNEHRAIRDYDNLEIKNVQDAIADSLMVDDISLYCSVFHTTLAGPEDQTEAYLMAPVEFAGWLQTYPIQTVHKL